MIRSRVELVDTLSAMERERQGHVEELEAAAKRSAELEVAVRAADEVRTYTASQGAWLPGPRAPTRGW